MMIDVIRATRPTWSEAAAAQISRLVEQVEHLTAMVQEMHARERAKPEIDARARYHLDDAATFLDVSASTLKRRAAMHRLVILYDGKTPYVMGAELLRYAREGAQRRRGKRGRREEQE